MLSHEASNYLLLATTIGVPVAKRIVARTLRIGAGMSPPLLPNLRNG